MALLVGFALGYIIGGFLALFLIALTIASRENDRTDMAR